MAVAYDAVSTANNSTGTTSLSWTHTPSGTPTAVGLFVQEYQNGVATVSATYNSVSMTQQVQAADGSANSQPRSTVFGLANPSSGAQTVAVTFSTSGFLYCRAVTVTGSDTTTCYTGSGSATAQAGTTRTLNCTSAANDLVVDGLIEKAASLTFTVGGSQTQIWNESWAGVHTEGGSYLAASGASTTMSWTVSAAFANVQTAVSFKVAGAAAGVTYPQLERFGHRGAFRGMLH